MQSVHFAAFLSVFAVGVIVLRTYGVRLFSFSFEKLAKARVSASFFQYQIRPQDQPGSRDDSEGGR
jgi:hypothetical protein